MNYFEACEMVVTRDQAKREIEKHITDGGFAVFLVEVGDRETYQGHEVLDWLGY